MFSLILLLYIPSSAGVEIRIKHLTTNEGLANNTVRSLFQDSKGFIWIGSLNGLTRYDGNSFTNFLPQEGNTLSLSDNRIKGITEDTNGFLWISTSSDIISCYDLKKDCFTDYTGCGEHHEQYRHLLITPEEIWVWGHDNGCRRITYQNGNFRSQTFNSGRGILNSNHITFIQQDKKVYWIGTDRGLYKWENGQLTCIDPNQHFQTCTVTEYGTFFITIQGIIYKSQGQTLEKIIRLGTGANRLIVSGECRMTDAWIILSNNGTYRFNLKTLRLQNVLPILDIHNGQVIKDNRNHAWIFNQTGKLTYLNSQTNEIRQFQLIPPRQMGLIDQERYHIIHDSRNLIWISTYGNGIFCYNPQTEELQHLSTSSDNDHALPSNFLHCIYEDHSGNLWTGTEAAGITRLSIMNEGSSRIFVEPDRSEVQSNVIRMITRLPNGNICLATKAGGLYTYDSSLSEKKNSQYNNYNIYSFHEDKESGQWIGTRRNGLYINGRLYVHQPQNPHSLSNNSIYQILKDRKGRMWIGTLGGGLELATKDKDEYMFRTFLDKTYGSRRIRTLCEDHNGYIWVGTSDGLYIFQPDRLIKNRNDYYHYDKKQIGSDEIRHILEDSQGRIWIGTAGKGLTVCKPGSTYKKLDFIQYGTDKGLVNNMVQAFVEDNEGKIWIPTEYGLSCFNPQNESFENHFLSPQMQGNIFNENAAVKLKNGNLAFGSNEGVVIINPREMASNGKKTEVTFTGLEVNGISVSPNDPDSPIQQTMPYTEKICLNHLQNSFIVHFSLLDFSPTAPSRYSYILENYDKEWSNISDLSLAAYKNVPPGEYRLRVKACNASGIWGSKEASISIVIVPPFWKTGWAYIIYILTGLAAVYATFLIIRHFTELKNKIKVEKQLTEYKLVFFTNISHEFRTPLTLIKGALDRIHKEKIPKNMAYSIKVMDKSTARMTRLIDQLLEFRKMQNNKLTLALEETDVIAFLKDIFESFEDASTSKHIRYRFETPMSSYKMFIDRNNLDKVIYNLLSNAFKYTPSGREISLVTDVNPDSKKLVIKVIDTGVGIPADKQSQLFTRFAHSNLSGNSMGIGLHLVHELVAIHKGSISYNENQDGGSIFTVKLPTDTSVYEKEDFLVSDNIILKEEEKVNEQRHPAISRQEITDETAEKEETGISTTEGSEQIPPLNQRKILIIEDDDDVREFLKMELNTYFEVETAIDGNNGLELACSHDFDLIISDVLMPGHSGFEITAHLKNDFRTSHIPVILLTALSSPDKQLEGMESGADAYITKPFSTKMLLTQVFKLIEQRDKLREKFSNDLSQERPIICTSDKDRKFVDKLNQIIEKELANPDLNVDMLSSEMAMGRTLLFRKVKGVTGYSPKEYVHIIRMKKAAELLNNGSHTISEVAYEVGISDPFYFSKCFKAQFGVPPSTYLKNIRQQADDHTI